LPDNGRRPPPGGDAVAGSAPTPKKMKSSKILSVLFCALAAAGLSLAADATKTISGEAMCAKCELKSQDTCQTVIQVKEGDKVVTYYVASNEVAKAFHSKVCHDTAQVTATGTVTVVDGKQTLTASAIDVKK
jgi:hypothetical protein